MGNNKTVMFHGGFFKAIQCSSHYRRIAVSWMKLYCRQKERDAAWKVGTCATCRNLVREVSTVLHSVLLFLVSASVAWVSSNSCCKLLIFASAVIIWFWAVLILWLYWVKPLFTRASMAWLSHLPWQQFLARVTGLFLTSGFCHSHNTIPRHLCQQDRHFFWEQGLSSFF